MWNIQPNFLTVLMFHVKHIPLKIWPFVNNIVDNFVELLINSLKIINSLARARCAVKDMRHGFFIAPCLFLLRFTGN